ncbi:MAG: LicD family protein [Prevotella sp.]|nr:LicD family protein [Prevotella sp.]
MTDNRVFNTGETQQQLREKYNPDGSPLRKAQMRMLDMLDYIDTVCREQDIAYRLDSGNVIGAVRHGGFIPWDDDIDIALSMSEYKRLCRYLHDNPHPQYAIQSPKTDRNYLYPWNKLRDTRTEYVMDYPPGSKDAKVFEQQKFKGLQIDIFPFEDRMLPRLQRLAGKMACVATFDIGKNHARLARMLFMFNMHVAFPLFRLMGKLFGNSSRVMHAYGTWFYKRYDKQTIVPYAEVWFEDRLYPAPADSEAFCRAVYGRFEELPPSDKREWHAKDIIYR